MFQDWVVKEFLSINKKLSQLSTDSKFIIELDEVNELSSGAFIVVFDTTQNKTVKYLLVNQDFSAYQNKNEKNEADGYVGLNSESFINPEYVKGLKPSQPIALTANQPHEYTLPQDADLYAIRISGASSVKIGTTSGSDDFGDITTSGAVTWQVGFLNETSLFIESDTDITITPMIFQW
ncbi:hypothetical protein DFQ07_1473 [Tenacibaculum caenipelagi]|uniref:Uncharacterized protein n=2 Tax=Tenacibaculum caenipelagi TaxID=1325435 RepID=A0A4R6TH43_9FLAO|nr:hypothetical protein DFQ07_1473 [Tenacibaculum caenipelagi]